MALMREEANGRADESIAAIATCSCTSHTAGSLEAMDQIAWNYSMSGT